MLLHFIVAAFVSVEYIKLLSRSFGVQMRQRESIIANSINIVLSLCVSKTDVTSPIFLSLIG